MQVLFYRKREVAGVGVLEDILSVTRGTPTLKANCLPGAAIAMVDQARFFGGQASAQEMTPEGFDQLVKRMNGGITH